jgi:hypothetical protein
VNYPGLPSHPQHESAKKLFPEKLFGGMISFEVKGAGKEQVFRFMEALEMIIPATTLGDVYSLVLYPPMSSHRALSPEERARIGIRDGLIRLSVGIEAEIVEDLQRPWRRAYRGGSRTTPTEPPEIAEHEKDWKIGMMEYGKNQLYDTSHYSIVHYSILFSVCPLQSPH